MTANLDLSDMVSALSVEDEEEMKGLMESGNYDTMAKKIKARLTDWKSTNLNIAVTGESGSGKSSFVNTLRGLTADDEGAAPVDVKETTLKPSSYPHPKYKNLVYWDLPGVGTLKFPIDKYFQEIQVEKYDFFIIISSERFSSYDVTLAQEIKRLGRKFYFVRSKIYNDLRGAKKSHPKTFNADNVMKVIRSDVMDNLAKLNLHGRKVFLVDMYEPSKFEFGLLTDTIASDLQRLTKEAFLFGISVCSRAVLRRKEQFLKSRIWKTAALSLLSSTLPIAGLSFLADVAVICDEIAFYRKQLGLDEKSLRRFAVEMDKDYDYLRGQIETEPITTGYVVKLLSEISLSSSPAETIIQMIPIISTIVNGPASYHRIYTALHYCLEKLILQANQLFARGFDEV